MRCVGIGKVLLNDLKGKFATLEPDFANDLGVVIGQHRIAKLAGRKVDT